MLTALPGVLMTSSAAPVAPISISDARIAFVSMAKSPDSIAMPPLAFVDANPKTRTSSLRRPSDIFSVLIGLSVIDVLVGLYNEDLPAQ